MEPIPDLSYFAVPGFISNMRERPVVSASIILQDGSWDSWDKELSEANPYLYTWLHQKTENTHDIYLPHTPPTVIHTRLFQADFLQLIEPARVRIRTLLKEYGIVDVDEFLQEELRNEEWFYLLFAGKHQHYEAARLTAAKLGVNAADLPAILLWVNIDTPYTILILPHQEDKELQEYIKSIYWSITTASSRASKTNPVVSISTLLDNILLCFAESHHIKQYSQKVRQIECLEMQQTVAEFLFDIGKQYIQLFNEAILSFQEDTNLTQDVSHSIIKYSERCRREVVNNLITNGFNLIREGANHEIYRHPNLNRNTPVPRHKSVTPFVCQSIMRDIRRAVVGL